MFPNDTEGEGEIACLRSPSPLFMRIVTAANVRLYFFTFAYSSGINISTVLS